MGTQLTSVGKNAGREGGTGCIWTGSCASCSPSDTPTTSLARWWSQILHGRRLFGLLHKGFHLAAEGGGREDKKEAQQQQIKCACVFVHKAPTDVCVCFRHAGMVHCLQLRQCLGLSIMIQLIPCVAGMRSHAPDSCRLLFAAAPHNFALGVISLERRVFASGSKYVAGNPLVVLRQHAQQEARAARVIIYG